jgi:hypothetical protein
MPLAVVDALLAVELLALEPQVLVVMEETLIQLVEMEPMAVVVAVEVVDRVLVMFMPQVATVAQA